MISCRNILVQNWFYKNLIIIFYVAVKGLKEISFQFDFSIKLLTKFFIESLKFDS